MSKVPTSIKTKFQAEKEGSCIGRVRLGSNWVIFNCKSWILTCCKIWSVKSTKIKQKNGNHFSLKFHLKTTLHTPEFFLIFSSCKKLQLLSLTAFIHFCPQRNFPPKNMPLLHTAPSRSLTPCKVQKKDYWIYSKKTSGQTKFIEPFWSQPQIQKEEQKYWSVTSEKANLTK